MKNAIIILILLVTACKSAPPVDHSKKDGVLSTYVKTPLNKASKVNEINDDRNKKLLQGLKEN